MKRAGEETGEELEEMEGAIKTTNKGEKKWENKGEEGKEGNEAD